MNKRTTTGVLVILVLIIAAWGGSYYNRYHKQGKYIQDLANDDPAKVMDAMSELQARGAGAGPALAEQLRGQDVRARERAAWLMGMIGYQKAEPELVSVLGDSETTVRIAALQSLGRLKATGSAATIQGILADEKQDLKVRQAAAFALGMIADEASVQPLVAILAKRPAPPVEPTVPAAADAPKPPPDTTLDLRRSAVTALGHIGSPQGLDALVSILKDAKDPANEVRVAAAYAVGDIAPALHETNAQQVAVEALLAGLKDSFGDVRIASAYSLRNAVVPAGQETEVGAALRQAADDKHYWVRRAAQVAITGLRISG